MSQHVAWRQKAVALQKRGGILMTQKLAQQVWRGGMSYRHLPRPPLKIFSITLKKKVPLLRIAVISHTLYLNSPSL